MKEGLVGICEPRMTQCRFRQVPFNEIQKATISLGEVATTEVLVPPQQLNLIRGYQDNQRDYTSG